jgi:L-threonylcarbamoyladenylate synthase
MDMTSGGRTAIMAADAAGIAAAARLIAAGEPVAVPTETVYGLAADATNGEAVARVYAAKGRPSFNPLIVHCRDLAEAAAIARLDETAQALATAFWPGALTIVAPLSGHAGIAGIVTAGLPSIALRVPAHPAMRALLDAVGTPLAAPSANRSGRISPTTAAHVASSLGSHIRLVLDGGPCRIGLESTIVAVDRGVIRLLRPGPIDSAAIARAGGKPVDSSDSGAVEAPGQLASHYAPTKPLRLSVSRAEPDEFHLGFGSIAGDWSLSPDGDLVIAAARLFAGLHLAEASDRPRIAVAPIPHEGLGRAIADRLQRAAAPASDFNRSA